LNKLDDDGNTPLHIVMRNFNADIQKSRKIAAELIKMGASLIFKNKQQNNPLNQALYGG
jgi:ankyrin repeat protein